VARIAPTGLISAGRNGAYLGIAVESGLPATFLYQRKHRVDERARTCVGLHR
jgi:hypothetical protein